MIAVTATAADDPLFSGANRGNAYRGRRAGVDVLVPAPAARISSPRNVGRRRRGERHGTLMLERNPSLTPDEVKRS